jgi:hypothetical protein
MSNPNFVPRVDGSGSLGRDNKEWDKLYVKEVHASTSVSASAYQGDGSGLTGISADMGGTMVSSIIPDTNSQYDLGSAEYKIRHLYLSDNSLWVGDQHKISIDGGKMKFKKRNGAPQVLKDALSAVNLEVDTAASQMVGNGILSLDGRQSITEANITLEELHIMAAHHGVDPGLMFSEANMDSDFNDDLVELSRTITPHLPDPSTLEFGTMVYDTDAHSVKVVASDDNGATKIWKTLSFV